MSSSNKITKSLTDIASVAGKVQNVVSAAMTKVQGMASDGLSDYMDSDQDTALQYLKLRTHVDRTVTPGPETVFRVKRIEYLRYLMGAINQYTRKREGESKEALLTRQGDIFKYGVDRENALLDSLKWKSLTDSDIEFCRNNPLNCPRADQIVDKTKTPSPPSPPATRNQRSSLTNNHDSAPALAKTSVQAPPKGTAMRTPKKDIVYVNGVPYTLGEPINGHTKTTARKSTGGSKRKITHSKSSSLSHPSVTFEEYKVLGANNGGPWGDGVDRRQFLRQVDVEDLVDDSGDDVESIHASD